MQLRHSVAIRASTVGLISIRSAHSCRSSGAYPYLSCAPGAALWYNRSLIVATWFSPAAKCSAVNPRLRWHGRQVPHGKGEQRVKESPR